METWVIELKAPLMSRKTASLNPRFVARDCPEVTSLITTPLKLQPLRNPDRKSVQSLFFSRNHTTRKPLATATGHYDARLWGDFLGFKMRIMRLSFQISGTMPLSQECFFFVAFNVCRSQYTAGS